MIDRPLASVLRQAGLREPVSRQSLSGGGAATIERVDLDDGSVVVVKSVPEPSAQPLREEAFGLRTLAATRTVAVASPRLETTSAGRYWLVLPYLERRTAPDSTWQRWGTQLAALHQAEGPQRFGFEHDNHCGATPQKNEWRDDWMAFHRDCRLAPQIRRAREQGLLQDTEWRPLEDVLGRLDRWLPQSPKASLLHGDLWSGNALESTHSSGEPAIALIDPACSYGDGWADIAMMRLFGGFPETAFAAYERAIGRPDGLEARLDLYQLYHVLNHVNLFGRSYLGQALAIARRYCD